MDWHALTRHPQLRDREAPLLFSFDGATRYVPVVAGAGLFAATIVLSALGPIDWQMDNRVEVYAFLVACLVSLCGGYVWATRSRGNPENDDRRPRIDASLVVVLGSLVYLALYPLTVYNSTGHWFPDVVTGLADPGRAYADKTAAELEIPQIATYLGMVVAPVTIGILPLTLFFWPRLTLLARGLGVLTTLLGLALGVARAVNQDVGEIAGYTVLFLILVAATSTRETPHRGRRIVACVAGAALVTGAFLAYYSSNLAGRVAADEAASKTSGERSVDDAMTSTALASLGRERDDSVFYTVVPAPAQPAGTLLTSYLTQGYKGLSLAMDSPWHPTYGLGFSTFLRHNVARVTGLDEDRIEARSYEGQLDALGWTAGVQWSTWFIHPASDISFFGVVPLMALFGLAFGTAWRDTCRRHDPLACIVFFYLGIQLLYLSANNQLYQGGQLAIGFTTILVAWLVLRRRPARAGARTPVAPS